MKKSLGLFLFVFLLAAQAQASTDETGRTTSGPFGRVGIVMERGLEGVVGVIPCDIPETVVNEARMHHWLWPVTMIGRLPLNALIRIVSSFYDIFIAPGVVPFTNDLSPFTEAFDLPEYACRRQ